MKIFTSSLQVPPGLHLGLPRPAQACSRQARPAWQAHASKKSIPMDTALVTIFISSVQKPPGLHSKPIRPAEASPAQAGPGQPSPDQASLCLPKINADDCRSSFQESQGSSRGLLGQLYTWIPGYRKRCNHKTLANSGGPCGGPLVPFGLTSAIFSEVRFPNPILLAKVSS